ncbi:MAG TPA: acyltransferase family protein [Puia sp.]|nr:acyltransferase family protein [Puia sp.]
MKNLKLELVRGLAALMVFFCHCGMNCQPLFFNPIYHSLTNWALEAVIIFFVLSGVVIHISQLNRPKSPNQFLLNRLKRLYPQYLVGLLLGFALYGWDMKLFLGHAFFLATLKGYIVQVIPTNPAVWSLTFEMFFYLLYYLYLRSGSNKGVMRVWIAASIICVPLYYLRLHGIAGHLIAMFAFSSLWLLGYFLVKYIGLIPKPTLPQVFFSVGILMLSARIRYTSEYYCIIKCFIFSLVAIPLFTYCLSDRSRNKKQLKWYYLIGAYLLFVGLIQVYSRSMGSSKFIYLFCPPAFYLCAVLLDRAAKIKALLLNIGGFLGNISYSLYIIHFPLLYIIGTIIGITRPVYFLPVALVTVIPLAWLLESITQRLFMSRGKFSLTH